MCDVGSNRHEVSVLIIPTNETIFRKQKDTDRTTFCLNHNKCMNWTTYVINPTKHNDIMNDSGNINLNRKFIENGKRNISHYRKTGCVDTSVTETRGCPIQWHFGYAKTIIMVWYIIHLYFKFYFEWN